jgi:hypothetical protein
MVRILQFVPAQIKLNDIVPRHPANPREVAGLAVGLHSESPGIGAEPARVPEPVGTSLREAGGIRTTATWKSCTA